VSRLYLSKPVRNGRPDFQRAIKALFKEGFKISVQYLTCRIEWKDFIQDLIIKIQLSGYRWAYRINFLYAPANAIICALEMLR
jgi:hypothetical protein